MTTPSITSNQEKQFKRFVEDATDKALKEINPDKDGLQRLIERGGEFQEYVMAGISRFTAKLPDYTLACTILGKDFISPEEIAKARRGIVYYTDEQLAQFADSLPSQEVMEWCRDNGYMLVAGPNRPMSLLDVRDVRNDYFYLGWYADWYADNSQTFSLNDKVETRWIMLRKEPVPESTSKNWGEQEALLGGEERVPNVAEVVWCVTTYKAVRNVYLLPSIYVRTSSVDSGGSRVGVGFDVGGLFVGDCSDDDRLSLLGVSSSRKF